MGNFAFDDLKNPGVVSGAKWNQPFPYEVPPFPISNSLQSKVERLANEIVTKDSYVPDHLPPYPPSHTYKRAQVMSKKRATESNEKSPRYKVRKISNLQSIHQSLAVIEETVDSAKS